MSDDKERLVQLENVLTQMLQPLRGVPFYFVVKALSKREIIPIDKAAADDKALIANLEQAVRACGKATHQKPIVRPRPNEVGNDIESYVMDGVRGAGLKCERPKTTGGSLKATGYPDILVFDATATPTYLECKIYGAGSVGTSMRSFYLSPSDEFKVSLDARHLLLAFEMERKPLPSSQDSEYRAKAFKLVDLHDLQCDVKYEFNSDNRRLYADGLVLTSGTI